MIKRLTAANPRALLLRIPAAGLVGFLLRLLLSTTGTDDKGLLISGRPDWILLLLLSIVTGLILLVRTHSIRGPAAYRRSFPRSPLAAAGCVLAALSALGNAVACWQSGFAFAGQFNLLTTIAGFLRVAALTLTPVALVLIGLCRLTERKPNFLLHVLVCISFALQTLSLYQTWSFDPQIQNYCFQLLACITLTITAYQLACFDIGKGSHRALWFWALASVYLCLVSAANGLFFITGGIWAWTNLSSLRRPRRPAAQIQEAEPSAEL